MPNIINIPPCNASNKIGEINTTKTVNKKLQAIAYDIPFGGIIYDV